MMYNKVNEKQAKSATVNLKRIFGLFTMLAVVAVVSIIAAGSNYDENPEYDLGQTNGYIYEEGYSYPQLALYGYCDYIDETTNSAPPPRNLL